MHLGRQPRSLLAEHEHTCSRELSTLEGLCTGKDVDTEYLHPRGRCPRAKLGNGWVMANVLISIGHHGSAPVPAPPPDNVHLGREERVRIPHHSPDVEVVLPVLNGNVERVPSQVKIRDDGLPAPVAIAIEHVTLVARGK